MLDRPEFADVLVQQILPRLSYPALAALYRVSSTLRDRIILYKNWKRLYRTTFPHDALILADNCFEQYIRRCNASLKLWNKGVLSQFPFDEVVVNLVASRFLVAAFTSEGNIYVGPEWVRAPGKHQRLWAGVDHLYAVGSGGGLKMWKFLDLEPCDISGLPPECTMCCSGLQIHAAVTSTGLYWWHHSLEGSISPRLLTADTSGVVDMLAMKNGLLVLKKTGLLYWHQMQELRAVPLPRGEFCLLRRLDIHRNRFIAVRGGGQQVALHLAQVQSFWQLCGQLLSLWQLHNAALKTVNSVEARASLYIGKFIYTT